MSITNQGSFLFHGSAFGFSARFEHPNKATIPTKAMAILAPTGGEASAHEGPFKSELGVMFDEAAARVAGSVESDGSRHSDVTASVRRLRFLNFVEADLIFARVNSVHRLRETRKGIIDEAEVNFGTSKIEGLVVGGQAIAITWDTDVFSDLPTFELLRNKEPKRGRLYAQGSAKDRTVVVSSIVKRIDNCQPLSDRERKNLENPEFALSGLRSDGNVLWVPHFGKIFIGEVIIQRGIRRINMLRMELGCGTGGGGTAGGGEGNGGEIPPLSF